MEDTIKKAFDKVKEDINFLNKEILGIKILVNDINSSLNYLKNEQKNLQNLHSDRQTDTSTDNSTLRQINSTNTVTSTDTSTVPLEIEGLKYPNLPISTGNEGASTDRQTDTSTDTSTDKILQNTLKRPNFSIESNIKEATEILDSLDSIKKEIRLKFKHLTPQEMLVFSSLYQLEDQGNKDITYSLLSKNLKLSQSSIRDYIQRMINKGIPIKKEKWNNKQVILSISSDLKKIATLNTILQLREL
jgi:hypothetical protein